MGAITKAGDKLLRSLLFEAANAVLTRCRRFSALKRWGVKLAARRGMNRARVAVARKLAIILHRMWCDGTEFRWSDRTGCHVSELSFGMPRRLTLTMRA